jgi:hypothetical protein
MNESVRYSTTSEGLEDLLATGRSGCLVSEAESLGPRVYTMLGEIMAVVSSRDGMSLVERLAQMGSLSSSQSSELRRSIRNGGDCMALISAEVSSEDLMRVCAELIRDNLALFLAASGPAWFESMDQLFVPGLQVSHETEVLLEEVRQQLSRAWPDMMELAEVQDDSLPAGVSSATESPVPAHESQDVRSRSDMGAFEDHDRHRMRGDGEFSVETAPRRWRSQIAWT